MFVIPTEGRPACRRETCLPKAGTSLRLRFGSLSSFTSPRACVTFAVAPSKSQHMPLTNDQLRSLLLAQLSPAERDHSIVYKSSLHIPKGKLQVGMNEIAVPWEAFLAFVDREPAANWGHSSRYILVGATTGELLSVESRFPPFQRNASLLWRTIYQAPTAPDWAVAAPKEE